MKKKGELQGSYGGNTPSLLNNSPFFENSVSQDSKNSQEENLDTIRKQRKSFHNLAPGRYDVVEELAYFAVSSQNAAISMIQNRQTNILGDDIGKGCEGFFASFSCMYSNINYNPNELGCPAQMNCTP